MTQHPCCEACSAWLCRCARGALPSIFRLVICIRSNCKIRGFKSCFRPTLHKPLHEAVWMFDVALKSCVHRMLSGYIVLSCSFHVLSKTSLSRLRFWSPSHSHRVGDFVDQTRVVRPSPRFERLLNKQKSSPCSLPSGCQSTPVGYQKGAPKNWRDSAQVSFKPWNAMDLRCPSGFIFDSQHSTSWENYGLGTQGKWSAAGHIRWDLLNTSWVWLPANIDCCFKDGKWLPMCSPVLLMIVRICALFTASWGFWMI